MRTAKAGLSAKLVILLMLVALILGILALRTSLAQAKEDLMTVSHQVQAQKEVNAGLSRDIEDGKEGLKNADVARERLGLVEPDEKVFVDANH